MAQVKVQCRWVDVIAVPVPDDFYAVPTARGPEPLPAVSTQPGAVTSGRPRGAYVAVVVALGLVAAMAAVSGAETHHSAGPVDLTPITLPATVDGQPMERDQSNDPGIQALFSKLFGARPAAAAVYGSLTSGLAPVVATADRGPITRLGDVKDATTDRQRLGDVSCGRFVYQKSVAGDVCWYSSATLGVCLNFTIARGDRVAEAADVRDFVAQVRDATG